MRQVIDPSLEALYSLKDRSTTRETVYSNLRRRSEAVRAQPNVICDIAYGPTPRERIDVFTQQGGAPVFVFVHGGYWRAFEKDTFLALCAPFAARGFVSVNVDYGLRPEFTVLEIVEQVLRAIAFIGKNALSYGGRAECIILCGHSAGGHMVAWAAGTDWRTLGAGDIDIRAIIPVSGIFDLEPLRWTSINGDLALDAISAEKLSPINRLDLQLPPTLGVVGGQETQGFLDQTRNFSTALQASGHIAQTLVAEHLDHFSVCQAISEPDSALFHRVNAIIDAQLGN